MILLRCEWCARDSKVLTPLAYDYHRDSSSDYDPIMKTIIWWWNSSNIHQESFPLACDCDYYHDYDHDENKDGDKTVALSIMRASQVPTCLWFWWWCNIKSWWLSMILMKMKMVMFTAKLSIKRASHLLPVAVSPLSQLLTVGDVLQIQIQYKYI